MVTLLVISYLSTPLEVPCNCTIFVRTNRWKEKRWGEGLGLYYIIYVMMIFVTAKIMVFPNCQVSWHLKISTLWYYSWLPFWCYCHHSKDCRIDVPFDGSIEIDQEIVECTFYCAFVGFSKINFIVKSDFVRKKQIYVHTYICTIVWISNLTVQVLKSM